VSAIRIMPEDLVLKIAAGEVVDRPASAVKELIDNAVDAGADTVRIEVRESGMKSLRVTDNGSGIARDDLEFAFTSHATSKIQSARDLDRLTTLGFRGEALPSIAAVSRVDVQTRTRDEGIGSRYRVHFGEKLELSSTAAPIGTRITVSDIFSNVPARKKFVRSLRAEAGQIASVVWQYALAQPGVHFILSVDGRVVFESPGTGRLVDALVAVHGLTVADAMVPVDADKDGLRVEALVSRPQITRQNRSAIHVAVNGRPISNRSIPFVLEEAYSGFLMVGRHPLAAVNLTLPPEDVDPNIHPSKLEVRMSREREVNSILYHAVSAALMNLRSEPLDTSMLSEFSAAPDGGASALPLSAATAGDGHEVPLMPETPALRVFGQSNRTFIIAEGPNGLYMIDQHAAHERILYDRFDQALDAGDVASQPLLEPISVRLSPAQMQALEGNRPLLASMGLTLEPFGTDSCLVRAVPAMYSAGAPGELVIEVLSELETLPRAESARERALAAMACKAAVKAGMMLDLQEMRELVTQLERTPRPATCPHGRPTMIHLSHTQLEKEFGRR
jgi:DNA mismatch repair protein MutL